MLINNSYNVRLPSYVCWFRFAPVTSSLFAYHKPVRDIGALHQRTDIVAGGLRLYVSIFDIYYCYTIYTIFDTICYFIIIDTILIDTIIIDTMIIDTMIIDTIIYN